VRDPFAAEPAVSRLISNVFALSRLMVVLLVRPSGLFDLPHVTEYTAGEVDPVGAFTSRSDLADYLVALAARNGSRDTVTVSTTADTPTMWQMIRREAFKSA